MRRWLNRWKLSRLGLVGAAAISKKMAARIDAGGRLSIFSTIFGHVGSVVIAKPFGRFGNQFFQLVGAIVLASRIGADSVIAKGLDLLHERSLRVSISNVEVVTQGSEFSVHRPRRNWGLTSQSFLNLVVNPFYVLAKGALVPRVTQREFDEVAKQLRGANLVPKVAALPSDHLVIHLRAGDVFSSNRPHPEYGQPPVGFYEAVLSCRVWAKIIVVREDKSHPLEPLIEGLAVARGIPIEFCSGSFADDLSVLLSAQALAASRGTLIPSVSCLSQSVREVFIFCPGSMQFSFVEEVLGPSIGYPSNVKKFFVADKSGLYWDKICSGNWQNTEDQVELMKRYGSNKIKVLG